MLMPPYVLDCENPSDQMVIMCGTRLSGHRWRNTTRKTNDYCLDCGCRRMVWVRFAKSNGMEADG